MDPLDRHISIPTFNLWPRAESLIDQASWEEVTPPEEEDIAPAIGGAFF